MLTTTPESVYPTHPVDHRLAEKIPAAVRVHRAGYQDPLLRLLSTSGEGAPARRATMPCVATSMTIQMGRRTRRNGPDRS